jgi:hypothetical protein
MPRPPSHLLLPIRNQQTDRRTPPLLAESAAPRPQQRRCRRRWTRGSAWGSASGSARGPASTIRRPPNPADRCGAERPARAGAPGCARCGPRPTSYSSGSDTHPGTFTWKIRAVPACPASLPRGRVRPAAAHAQTTPAAAEPQRRRRRGRPGCCGGRRRQRAHGALRSRRCARIPAVEKVCVCVQGGPASLFPLMRGCPPGADHGPHIGKALISCRVNGFRQWTSWISGQGNWCRPWAAASARP